MMMTWLIIINEDPNWMSEDDDNELYDIRDIDDDGDEENELMMAALG